MTGGEIEIVEASHDIDVDELEDIVYSHDAAHCLICASTIELYEMVAS